MRSLLALILLLPLAIHGEETAPAAPVTIIPLGKLWIKSQHSAPASVVALNRSRLSAEINAKIETIHVKVGEQVSKGQPLVSLDCRDYRSRYAQQQAELTRLQSRTKEADNKLKRARNLKTDRNISQEQLEARETELTSLRAQLKAQHEIVSQHRRNVERCDLIAPFAGEVVARLASEGELAAPGTPLIELVQQAETEVEAEIRPEMALQLKDAEASLLYLNKTYPLKLARLSASLDEKTRTLTVRFVFNGKPAPIGSAGRLLWTDPRPYLPADYIQQRNNQLGFFAVQGSTNVAGAGSTGATAVQGRTSVAGAGGTEAAEVQGRTTAAGSENTAIASFHPLKQALEGRPAPAPFPADILVIDQGRHGLKDGDKIKLVK